MNDTIIHRTARLLLVGCLILAVSGCSIKMAYNNLDRLVRWGVSDYMDLDAEQRDYLQAEVKKLVYWHRTNHLPMYSEYMVTLADRLSDGVTDAQIEDIFNQLLLWGDEVEDRALPIAVNVLVSLSDEQVAALPARLEKSNVEIEEDEKDRPLEKVQDAWAQEMEDALERFTGRLDIRQRNYINRRAQGYEPERELWADYRRRWQADLLALLEERDAQDFGPRFVRLSKSREEYYGDEYARISEANLALARDVSAYVLSNLSDRQSVKFKDSLTKLGEDFAELAQEV